MIVQKDFSNKKFILGLKMMHPVLQLINKVSKMEQTENYDLLWAKDNIKATYK